ncbi:U-box domain-containing protein 4 [Andrographis paniculata]|uniref:U-box domain-containing protein 4 n=1 Tax=Andrographis paniculata TaxID=175694 RepID=UPI0021E708B2|nr:U-box domain-containing protein 4 [Andrographis paniculata]XP_051117675.1 U-box domain-containing protein 4 [Andrographis paniculata]XP_051117676.1 U-box domain-containing protein 4 [Andrographis paniculata]XP_051117677.1 U-box domain-containing protein 4 [Andrographis paniculata]XP_051117678.1 U-box domain-containing protein 4 [Andrographis paniculata]XP_051117679.1 U-box domain-containing protein 4 [Andrographis paniculata]XP_051117680.1 U-box domain-containing protein 4 [Andrographis pa
MAEALLFGEREAQILAAREIGHLSTKQKQVLSENGVIPPLVLMLHSHDYDSVEASLFALLNLAFGSERNKRRIVKAGAVPAILEIIRQQNEPLLELALAFLLVLSSCSSNKSIIVCSGGIQLLIELFDSQFPNCQCVSNQAKFDIISTLHNLSNSPQAIASIMLSGGLITLIQFVYESEKSSSLAEKAVALLESIVSSSEAALNQACEVGGVIQMLVEAVEEGSPECQEHAAGILLMICRRSRDRYRGMILKEGAMPGLLQLSVDGSRRAREKARSLLILLRDCGGGGGSGGGVSMSKKAALEEVMRKIDSGERSGSNSVEMVEEMIARLRT